MTRLIDGAPDLHPSTELGVTLSLSKGQVRGDGRGEPPGLKARGSMCRWRALGVALVLASMTGVIAEAQASSREIATPPMEPIVASVTTTAVETQFQTFRRGRPIFRIWQDFTLPAGDEIRQVVLVLGSATIDGTVHGDVIAWFGNVRLGSTAVVNGSVVVVAGNLTIAPGATLWRDLVMIGGAIDAPAAFTPGGDHFVVGSPVLGQRLREIAAWVTRGLLWGRIIVPGLPWVWWVLAVVFVLSFLFNHIFDQPVRAAADVVLARPLGVLLMGMLLIVVMGPLFVILAASIIGLLVVPFAIGAVVIGWTIGKVGVTRAIGMSVIHPSDPTSRFQSLRSFLIGFVILAVAYAIPVLGFAAWALVGLFGLGAAGLTFVEKRRRERPAPLQPEVPVAAPAPEAMAFAAAAAAAPAPEPFAQVVMPPAAPRVEPPPPGATALLPHAAFFDRAAAFALDCILVAIATHLLNRTGDDGMFFLLLLAYHIAFWIWKGTTLGGIVCNLRVVRTNGEPLRPVDAVVRALSSLFSIAALGIGCLWMLRDPDRQTWHDKIANTFVVKVPKDWPLP